MLAGGAPTGCQYCWGLESEGLTSNRTYYMSLLKKELLTSNLESPVIKSLDLKPSNTCNFKCRICNPKSSSLFAQEAGISVKQFRWAEKDSKTIDEIINLLPTLINIDMFGGEPFLIKPLLKILSTAVDLGYANNIRLHYNSNGSIYPENLIEYWKKFKHVDIHFSIDNIGDRFELERGGSWAIVESNIKKLISLNLPNVKISIMPAISIMNIFYFDELIQFANKLNLSVNPLYVSKPSGFDIKNLTAEAKQLINEKFKHHQWTEIKNILNYINKLPDSNGKEFINLCKHFDNLRNQNFSKSHPEIAKAMGYI
jgi:sulfatase maturation enzyme AslB (radical SAM superfamily)